MIVEAKCIKEAFENQTTRHFYPGIVKDFDTENERLNALTTESGLWVFQYPGHEGRPSKQAAPVVVEPVVDKRVGRKLPEAQKRRMQEGRMAKKAKLLAAVEEPA